MKKCLCCESNSLNDNMYICSSCQEAYNLSNTEIEFLNYFLNVSFNEYNLSERSIFMSSSTEVVIGSCRRILNDIIINLYSNSNKPLDILAIAMTYTRMYAAQRPLAIAYFEKYIKSPVPIPTIYHFAHSECTMIEGRPAYTLWNIFSQFANIYQEEKKYIDAIKCLEECIKIDNGNNPADYRRIGENLSKIDLFKAEKYYLSLLNNKSLEKYYQQFESELNKIKKERENELFYEPYKERWKKVSGYDRQQYSCICKQLPEIAPKSFSSYMRMKRNNTKNFQKLAEEALKHNICLDYTDEIKQEIDFLTPIREKYINTLNEISKYKINK